MSESTLHASKSTGSLVADVCCVSEERIQDSSSVIQMATPDLKVIAAYNRRPSSLNLGSTWCLTKLKLPCSHWIWVDLRSYAI